jgi:hypothetical protein
MIQLLAKLLGIREVIVPSPIFHHHVDEPRKSGHTFSTTIEDTYMEWDVETLWTHSESLPVTQWEIPDSFLEEWNWGSDHPSEHIERCLEADLCYPILVWDGIIVDGCHRAVKSIALGFSTIPCKVINTMPPTNHDIHPHEEEESTGKWTHDDMVKILRVVLDQTLTPKDK